ncbi:MAG TPA: nucleotidyltransferase family protein [Longimicrobiales bacterium]|nr:nucleotidyltransferase family protein [Longimicrobiales bacterium]
MSAPAVDGIILAAGLSSRMERPKPLLNVGSVTFLERAVTTLQGAGCRRTYVVVNATDQTTADAARALGADVVVNEYPESEPIDSVRMVIEQLPADTGAVVVLPVDLPLIAQDTVTAVVRSFRENPGPLILPFHNGVAGHPVLIGRDLFGDIMTRPFDEGLRSLIMESARTLREVRVVDPGILIDIDTPDDYWRFIESK